jgi:hypothetical protein
VRTVRAIREANGLLRQASRITRPRRPAGEIQKPAPHAVEGAVLDPQHLEAETLEGDGDIVCVVARIFQRRDILVGAIADHQRNAPGLGGSGN